MMSVNSSGFEKVKMAAAKASTFPDLQRVSLDARNILEEILDEVDTDQKCVVIQPELISLLDHVASVKYLKSHRVGKIYRLDRSFAAPAETYRFYITRPDINAVNTIASHIAEDKKAGKIIFYYIVFVPRKLACCDLILETEGVYGAVVIKEWPLTLIPLDEHILSLEIPEATQTLCIDEDYTLLHSIAHSVLQLEFLYGNIATFHGKGQLTERAADLLFHLKELFEFKNDQRVGPSQIDELIMIDRTTDLVTPLCSQMTYEGMLDDVLSIRNGYVQFGAQYTGKQGGVKVLLNSNDPVYKLIRGQLFSDAPAILSRITEELDNEYTKGKSAEDIKGLKMFVNQLPDLRKKHDSLSTHLRASEKIVRKKKDEEFRKQLSYERAILEGQDTSVITEYIDECIQRQMNFLIPLRLMCLLSMVNGYIKSKYYRPLKHLFLQSYGYQHLITFNNLEQIGLLKEKTGDEIFQSSFKLLNKVLRLVPKYPPGVDMATATDMSYVFGGAYLPLSCAVVKSVMQVGGWQAMDEVCKVWRGPAFTGTTFSRMAPQQLAAAPLKKKGSSKILHEGRTILVYYIGGCTFSEINALQRLGEELKCHIIVATTNLINSNTLLGNFISPAAAS